jgi:hypothetical protein
MYCMLYYWVLCPITGYGVPTASVPCSFLLPSCSCFWFCSLPLMIFFGVFPSVPWPKALAPLAPLCRAARLRALSGSAARVERAYQAKQPACVSSQRARSEKGQGGRLLPCSGRQGDSS